MNDFARTKKNKLDSTDLSKKGSIDEPIKELVLLINDNEAYVTTSSCSGRIIVISQDYEEPGHIQKRGCKWIINSHSLIDPQILEEAVSGESGRARNAVLKFEPFILHVQCRSLEDARIMHLAALESGFRNSGLTIGKRGKVVLAVRSTHGLEVPLTDDGHKLMVNSLYLKYISQKANERMTENEKRIERFYLAVKKLLKVRVEPNTS